MKIFSAFAIAVLAVGCTKPVAHSENNAASPEMPRMDAAIPEKPGMNHAESVQALEADRQETDRAKKVLDDLEREVFETGSSLVTMRGEQEAAKNGEAAGREEAIAMWQKKIDEANKSIAKLKKGYEAAYTKWLEVDERATKAEEEREAAETFVIHLPLIRGAMASAAAPEQAPNTLFLADISAAADYFSGRYFDMMISGREHLPCEGAFHPAADALVVRAVAVPPRAILVCGEAGVARGDWSFMS